MLRLSKNDMTDTCANGRNLKVVRVGGTLWAQDAIRLNLLIMQRCRD